MSVYCMSVFCMSVFCISVCCMLVFCMSVFYMSVFCMSVFCMSVYCMSVFCMSVFCMSVFCMSVFCMAVLCICGCSVSRFLWSTETELGTTEPNSAGEHVLRLRDLRLEQTGQLTATATNRCGEVISEATLTVTGEFGPQQFS